MQALFSLFRKCFAENDFLVWELPPALIGGLDGFADS
jgi:hypothetical protein